MPEIIDEGATDYGIKWLHRFKKNLEKTEYSRGMKSKNLETKTRKPSEAIFVRLQSVSWMNSI